MKNDDKIVIEGGGFLPMLAVAFIVLKLCGVINWKWLWVLAPIWIPFVVVIAIMLICIIVLGIAKIFE
jgi:hypothetical protein